MQWQKKSALMVNGADYFDAMNLIKLNTYLNNGLALDAVAYIVHTTLGVE